MIGLTLEVPDTEGGILGDAHDEVSVARDTDVEHFGLVFGGETEQRLDVAGRAVVSTSDAVHLYRVAQTRAENQGLAVGTPFHAGGVVVVDVHADRPATQRSAP